MAKKKKNHKKSSLSININKTPSCTYHSMIWYCINCNYRWNFVKLCELSDLPGLTLDGLYDDYVQLYNMLHQYTPKNSEMKEAITEKYNKIISKLPETLLKSISETENPEWMIYETMKAFSRNGLYTKDILFYYKYLVKSVPEYQIMLDYGKYVISEQIINKVVYTALLQRLIENKKRYKEFISVDEKLDANDKLWELFLHSSDAYDMMSMFIQLMELLQRKVIYKSDYKYCTESLQRHISTSTITHCLEYIASKNK